MGSPGTVHGHYLSGRGNCACQTPGGRITQLGSMGAPVCKVCMTTCLSDAGVRITAVARDAFVRAGGVVFDATVLANHARSDAIVRPYKCSPRRVCVETSCLLDGIVLRPASRHLLSSSCVPLSLVELSNLMEYVQPVESRRLGFIVCQVDGSD